MLQRTFSAGTHSPFSPPLVSQDLAFLFFWSTSLSVPVPMAFYWKEEKSKCVLPPIPPFKMSSRRRKKNYQTKVCYFWNMCSFQQGRRLHLLSSDTSFLRPLKFVDIFLVCFNKACLTSHCLHWCRGFSEDCCILYPCGQKDTGLSFLFPFPFQRIYLWNLPTEVWPMPDPQEFGGFSLF